MVAQRYDLSAEDRDVLDRLLRRRVSEDAIRTVVRRMGTSFEAHMGGRLRTLSPELGMRWHDGAGGPARPAGGRDDCAALVFPYPEEDCRLVLHLDRPATALVNDALLGGDPDGEITPVEGAISQLELGLLQAVADAAARTRQADRPMLAFDGVTLHRGDDAALADDGGDAVATLTYALSFGVNRAWCWLDIPHRLLIELSAELTAREATAAAAREKAGFNVPDFALEVEVAMPLAGMTLERLARLKPGDVIECAPAGDGGATLKARGRDLFATQIGRLGHANAARVSGPIAPLAVALRAHAHQHSTQGDN